MMYTICIYLYKPAISKTTGVHDVPMHASNTYTPTLDGLPWPQRDGIFMDVDQQQLAFGGGFLKWG